VRGRWGWGTESDRWIYIPVYNPEAGDSYIVAVRPRENGDPHGNELSFFTMGYQSGKECKITYGTGLKGSQARYLIWAGNDSNVDYFPEGKDDQFPLDTAYTYAANGTLFGTRLRRAPDRLKKVTGVKFSTLGCTSTETIAVDIVYTDFRGTERTVRCGSPVTQNGLQVLPVPAGGIEAVDFYPKPTLARGATTTASPKIRFNRLTVEGSIV
jgi:hypothetical protein